ncbi:MAG: ImmA/IrrE family metallo-endopeptidase [Cyanobacteria bacterium J06642_11]
MKESNNSPRWPNIADRAANFLKLDICWDSIPVDNGTPVFARIYPTRRLIELNEDLELLQSNTGLEQSTLGHEIGHWMLHVNQDEAQGITEQTKLVLENPASQTFLCRSVDNPGVQSVHRLSAQAESVEWQAQYFSSCLLMPRHKLMEVQQGRSLTNIRHLHAIKDELGVSFANLKHRLRDLGWIQTRPGSKQLYLGYNAPIRKVDPAYF